MHVYLYTCMWTEKDETQNSFVDGLYRSKERVLREEHINELKTHVQEKHNVNVRNFNEMSVVTLTYLGKDRYYKEPLPISYGG